MNELDTSDCDTEPLDTSNFDTEPLDTSNCETEPLRFPAATQRHGALLVLAASGIIEAASATCASFLGAAAESLLGRPVGDILGSAAQAALLGNPCDGVQPLVPLSLHGRDLSARPRLNQARQVLVDIEIETEAFSSMRGTAYHRREVLASLRLSSDLQAIAQLSTEMVRGMTGYDRVMFYRFDEAWNGEVIGEACIEGITPYLGLHFPATDIPRQARELLSSGAVRLIPDALYTPSALISQGGRPVDLGASGLRSVSPTHIEYLRNMEVRATLVGSLIVAGRLWGLVSCQHKSGPKYFAPSVRDALGWLFEDLAAVIETTTTRLRRSREYSLATRRRRLVEAVRKSDLRALIHPAHSADLLGVVAADGFALLAKDSIQTTGCTPSVERIRILQSRRRGCETTPTLFASSALARDLQLEDAGDSVAGAVFVSLGDDPHVTLIWFRRERNFSVHWGGDPERMRIADEAGRFSPRKSFAQFTHAISGQSLAWTPEELDSVAELGSLIEIEALRERQAFTLAVINSARQRLAILDTAGVIVLVNDAWREFAAANPPRGPAADVIGLNYRSASRAAAGLPQGQDADRAWAAIEGVLSKTLPHFAFEYACKSLEEDYWFRMGVFPVRAPGEGAVVVHDDITVSVNTALALAKARERAALAIHSGGIGIWEWNSLTNSMMWDPQMYRLYGMAPRDEFGGIAGWLSRLHPDDRPEAIRLARQAIATGEPFDSEFRVMWPDGSEHYLRGAGLVVRDAAGRASGIVGTNLDITEPRRLAQSLAEQHERLRVTLRSIGDAVITTDADGRIDFLNPAAKRLTGWPPAEAFGLPLEQVFRVTRPSPQPGGETADELDRQDSASEGQRTRLTSRAGQVLDIEESSAYIRKDDGELFGIVLVFRDITDRKAMELELEQHRLHLEKLVDERTAALEKANDAAAAAHRASMERLNAEREAKIESGKLEAVGTLAAGIAHDFNNILASIVAYAELADDELPSGSDAKNNVAKVISGSFRARDLVARILDFARKREGDLVPVNIVFQVREALALLRASLPPTIELDLQSSIGEAGCTLQADPTQIMQIVMNLCINAAHAMDNHGIIGISIDPARAILDAPAEQLDSACITVADTGSGMTPAVIERIFDPFFTTKAPGEGSGLGLSVVYGIVKNLGGVIQVRSSAVFADSGTRFHVFLPATPAA